MARKPAHLVSTVKSPGGRQAMWEVMRRLRTFSHCDIADTVKAPRDTVRTYIDALVAGGFLAHAGTRPQGGTSFRPSRRGAPGPKVFELIRDIGADAPRLRRDGSPCLQGRSNEQMWRTMKRLDLFTYRDLALMSSTEEQPVDEDAARHYVKHLVGAGYLAVVTPGSAARLARYRFIRDTGPRPPQIQRLKTVFDANLRQIVWHDEVPE